MREITKSPQNTYIFYITNRTFKIILLIYKIIKNRVFYDIIKVSFLYLILYK